MFQAPFDFRCGGSLRLLLGMPGASFTRDAFAIVPGGFFARNPALDAPKEKSRGNE